MAEQIYEQQTEHFTYESISLVAIFEARKKSYSPNTAILAFDAKGTAHQWLCSKQSRRTGNEENLHSVEGTSVSVVTDSALVRTARIIFFAWGEARDHDLGGGNYSANQKMILLSTTPVFNYFINLSHFPLYETIRY